MPDPRALRRSFPALALIMLLAGTLYAPAQANDSAATYDAAVVKAQANAADPGPWKVTDLKVITGPGTRDGNTSVDGRWWPARSPSHPIMPTPTPAKP